LKIRTPIQRGDHAEGDLAKTCPICVETLDLWTAIYGAEAGNLALKVLALGGVYVAGGIAVKIIEKIKTGLFSRVQKTNGISSTCWRIFRFRGAQ